MLAAFLMTMARRAGARLFVFDYRAGMEMAVRALGGSYSTVRAGRPTGLNPLQTEIDARGQAWLADWLASLLERRDRPLTPVQTNRLQEVVRQNASAGNAGLRNWSDFASLLVSTDDDGDLFERMQEWTAEGRYGWIFGSNTEDTFSLDGDVSGFDLTGILDSESERERMAVLSYLFRRVERVIEDRKPTIIVIDEAWKALDNAYFAERHEQLAGDGPQAERRRRDDDAVCEPARAHAHRQDHRGSRADTSAPAKYPRLGRRLRHAGPERQGARRASGRRLCLAAGACAR